MREMLAFAELANQWRIACFIKDVLYDSNSDTARYTLSDEAMSNPFILDAIRNCAKETLAQFEHADEIIYHGKPCPCGDCQQDKVASLSDWRKRKETRP